MQKFSTLGRFLVLTCLTLFITGFVPAAHAYQVITIYHGTGQAETSVNEGESFTFRVRRTGSAEDDANNYNFTTQFELKIAPVSPIAGFNILSGGGATDTLERTVTFNPGVRDVSFTVETLDNELVSDDITIRVQMKTPTSELLQGAYLNVLVVDDEVYTLKVELVTTWQRNESEDIQVRFLRCVGMKNTEAITNCFDTNGAVRAGASTAALTEEIFIEKQGNYFMDGYLFNSLEKTVDGRSVIVDAVSLGANEFSKTYTLNPVDDAIDEPNGSLIIRTYPNSEQINIRKALTQIRDNDFTKVRVDRHVVNGVEQHPIDEGATPAFVFKRYDTEYLSPATFQISLFYHDKLLAATITRPTREQFIRFAQGVNEVVYRPFTTEDDSINEGDGRVAVRIDDVIYDIGRQSVRIAPYQNTSTAFAAVRVVDDEIPMVTLSANATSIVETDTMEWQLTRDDYEETRLRVRTEYEFVRYYPDNLWPDSVSKGSTSSLFLLAHISSGLLSQTFEYGGRNLVGPQGGYIRFRLMPFPTDGDSDPLVRHNHPSFAPRYTVADSDWVRLDITNDGPGVEVKASQDSVTEGGNALFTLKRYGGAADIIQNYATRVRIDVSQTGNYLPAHELGVRTVTIPAGQESAILTIITNRNNNVHPNGSVTVTILNGAPTDQTEDTYDVDKRYSDLVNRYIFKSTVDILNDDTAGVTISPTTLYVSEGASETYTVVLDNLPSGDVTVTPSRSSGDTDVTVSGALTFTPDNWSSAQTVTVSAAEDTDELDGDATITHTVSGGSYGSVTADSVSVFELDNDGAADSDAAFLLVTNQFISESASATTITVTAYLNRGGLSFDTPVTVSVGGGDSTATSGTDFILGTDFIAVTDFTITIAAGDVSQTGTFTLTLNSDEIDEAHETVVVSGTTTVTDFPVTGTLVNILDDDDAPTVTLVLTPGSIEESDDSATSNVQENRAVVTATLDRPSSVATTVTVSVLPNAPSVAGDYSLSANKELTIAAESKSSTGTVTITAVDNALDTADKTVAVKGSATNTLGITAPADQALTIVDDDGIEPTNESASTGVQLSVDDQDVLEPDSATTITVTAALNGGSRSSATPVAVSVGGGASTATSGTDFATVNDFTITIAAGTLSQTATFTLDPTDDDVDETNETVAVAGTTTVTGFTVTGTAVNILDDDFRGVTVSISSLTVDEGGTGTYTVVLDSQPTADVTVTPSRSSGDADVTVSGARTFTPNNWSSAQPVTVSAAQDLDSNNDT